MRKQYFGKDKSKLLCETHKKTRKNLDKTENQFS